MKLLHILLGITGLFATGISAQSLNEDYGVDVSFPIHNLEMKDGPLGNRRKVYDEFMNGCREHYGKKKANRCDVGEAGRLEMTLRQAQSMVVSILVRTCFL
jgi:hypothetical protein